MACAPTATIIFSLRLMGFSTAALLKSVGAIVLFAMLAAPAATAKLIAHSARCVVIYAFFVALFSGLLALLISCYAHFSVSALAALLAASSYALTRGYLWLRERKAAALENACGGNYHFFAKNLKLAAGASGVPSNFFRAFEAKSFSLYRTHKEG